MAFATVPVIFPATILLNPPPSPKKPAPFAVNLCALVFPLTFNDVNVPIDVILGCAFVYTVPAINALPT